ncbi:hypothetical protein EJ04DRAFT_550972 [Polyplosphaeria fusca]|uniref:Uncharacterized protein n=1 Tax=Polyplosphaeria fusca TaxID=682080 RepID=A0A9P4R4Q4_9PLEO|nr:hypothetical protein EJ04DRAFT_550972 [Polyplosphaeria fusca]
MDQPAFKSREFDSALIQVALFPFITALAALAATVASRKFDSAWIQLTLFPFVATALAAASRELDSAWIQLTLFPFIATALAALTALAAIFAAIFAPAAALDLAAALAPAFESHKFDSASWLSIACQRGIFLFDRLPAGHFSYFDRLPAGLLLRQSPRPL